MIVADLCRAAVVLLFLLVRDPQHVWIIYAGMFLKESLTALFEPARQAVIPTVTTREQLIPANAIAGVTWSVILAGGAAVGGVVVDRLGADAAFVLDSASFLLSAAIIASIPIPETHLDGPKETGSIEEFREGLGYLLGHRDILLYALSKSLWSIGGGGILVVIPLLGKDLYPLGKDGALSMGLLFAARGLGAAIGPVLARRLGGESTTFLRRMIGPGFFLMALGYLSVSRSDGLAWAALGLIVAHTGASIQWVYSTTLLQLGVPPRLQGRIFAIELALFTLALTLSSYATGVAKDAGASPPELALVLGLLAIPPGLLYCLVFWRPANREG
jgi:predicted MFS family arabinose efflux permease